MPSYEGKIHWLTVTSLLRLESPCLVSFKVVPRRRIDKARNSLAWDMLNKGYDYLLFIDDDNPVPPDTITKLLEDDKDIVTTPILARRPNKDGTYGLCAYYGKSYNGVRLYNSIGKFRDKGYLHRIDNCGMGCTLIKRKVLETLNKKYGYIFEFGDIELDPPITVGSETYRRRTMSEDMEFGERAIDAGFEIWLDERVIPVHLGESQYLQWSKNG